MTKYWNRKPMKNVKVVQTTAIHNGQIERYVVGKRKPTPTNKKPVPKKPG